MTDKELLPLYDDILNQPTKTTIEQLKAAGLDPMMCNEETVITYLDTLCFALAARIGRDQEKVEEIHGIL